ncbi:hypothetical protein SLEP1_g52425 [Rubroshorea leprosula]|uniref:Uncharacterized protein n=1 Tax=Rubroshorea leprosula TaxID=152421 RepID=A0AAV5M6B3_9ROSI|nr:hypothetical protein SLEP1_g52425 [Rubroshorea leprosula]
MVITPWPSPGWKLIQYCISYISRHWLRFHSPVPLAVVHSLEPVAPMVTSLDVLYLFVGDLSGNICTFSVPSGQLLRSYYGDNKPVSCLRVNEDGSPLISGGEDGTVAFVPIFQLDEASAEKDPSNTTIISWSMDCTCKFWKISDRGDLIRTVTYPCARMGVTYHQTHTELYAAASGGQVMVNEGKNLVSAAEDVSVCIWKTETEQAILDLANIDMGSISDLGANTGLETKGINDVKLGKSDDNIFRRRVEQITEGDCKVRRCLEGGREGQEQTHGTCLNLQSQCMKGSWSSSLKNPKELQVAIAEKREKELIK